MLQDGQLEQQEPENGKRRITRPRIQYSPMHEIGKKRIFLSSKKYLKIQSNNRREIVHHTGDSFSESSSSYSTSKDDFIFFKEEEQQRIGIGLDMMTQRQLRDQLERIMSKNFTLPDELSGLKTENNSIISLGDSSQQDDDLFETINTSLDDQEEIKLIADNPTSAGCDIIQLEATPSHTNANEECSIVELDIVEKPQIEPAEVVVPSLPTPFYTLANNYHQELPPPNFDAMECFEKRSRRPTRHFDDFVCTPLTKLGQTTNKAEKKREKEDKVMEKKAKEEGLGGGIKLKIRFDRPHQIPASKEEQSEQMDIDTTPSSTTTDEKEKRARGRPPRKISSVDGVQQTQVATTDADTEQNIGKNGPGRPRKFASFSSRRFSLPTNGYSSSSVSSGLDVGVSNAERPEGIPGRRVRRPPRLDSDFVYTPLNGGKTAAAVQPTPFLAPLTTSLPILKQPLIGRQRQRRRQQQNISLAEQKRALIKRKGPAQPIGHLLKKNKQPQQPILKKIMGRGRPSHQQQQKGQPRVNKAEQLLKSLKLKRKRRSQATICSSSITANETLSSSQSAYEGLSFDGQEKGVGSQSASAAAAGGREGELFKAPLGTPSVQLDFFERMEQRKKMNPMAMGIEKFSQFATEDYFYKEIFVTSTSMDEGGEEIVDCFGEVDLEAKSDEQMTRNQAEECAFRILNIIQKSQFYSAIDLDKEEDIDVEKCLNERIESLGTGNLVKEFIQILLKRIYDQRLVDMVSQGVLGGASMFYSLTMKNANRLRESLKLYSKSSQEAILQSHTWLLRNIPPCHLMSYLNLLRFVKIAGSNLSDFIVKFSEDMDIWNANKIIRSFIAQKVYEPPMNPSFKPIKEGPMPNVSLVLVYPQITMKICKHITHAHETLFRNLLPMVVCCVEKVELNLDVADRPHSVEECAWMCIKLIRQRVREIVRRRPNDHIFLAGWGPTCWLNHSVILDVHGVSGILNFAFPTESACGSRGSVEDMICLTYPATLFVVGEEAANVNMAAITQLRRNMLCDTGLIVIGGANHNLLVSQCRLSLERVTQFVVQRTIVEYAVQFMKQVITDLGTPKECRDMLKPVELPNPSEIDPNLLRSSKPAAASTTTTTGRPRKTTVSKKGAAQAIGQPSTSDAPGHTLAHKAHSRPTKMAAHLPPQLQPTAPTALAPRTSSLGNLYAARSTFSSSLKKSANVGGAGELGVGRPRATTESVLKVPSPEELNRQLLRQQSLAGASVAQGPSTSASTMMGLREEEEEAAAALSLLK